MNASFKQSADGIQQRLKLGGLNNNDLIRFPSDITTPHLICHPQRSHPSIPISNHKTQTNKYTNPSIQTKANIIKMKLLSLLTALLLPLGLATAAPANEHAVDARQQPPGHWRGPGDCVGVGYTCNTFKCCGRLTCLKSDVKTFRCG